MNQGRQDIIIVPGVTNCFSCVPNPLWTVEIDSATVAVPTSPSTLAVGTTTLTVMNGYMVLPDPQLYVLAGNNGRRDLLCTDSGGIEYEARLISPRELKILLKFTLNFYSSLSPPLPPPPSAVTTSVY